MDDDSHGPRGPRRTQGHPAGSSSGPRGDNEQPYNRIRPRAHPGADQLLNILAVAAISPARKMIPSPFAASMSQDEPIVAGIERLEVSNSKWGPPSSRTFDGRKSKVKLVKGSRNDAKAKERRPRASADDSRMGTEITSPALFQDLQDSRLTAQSSRTARALESRSSRRVSIDDGKGSRRPDVFAGVVDPKIAPRMRNVPAELARNQHEVLQRSSSGIRLGTWAYTTPDTRLKNRKLLTERLCRESICYSYWIHESGHRERVLGRNEQNEHGINGQHG